MYDEDTLAAGDNEDKKEKQEKSAQETEAEVQAKVRADDEKSLVSKKNTQRLSILVEFTGSLYLRSFCFQVIF